MPLFTGVSEAFPLFRPPGIDDDLFLVGVNSCGDRRSKGRHHPPRSRSSHFVACHPEEVFTKRAGTTLLFFSPPLRVTISTSQR